MFNHALIALYYAYLLFIRTTAEECSESVNTPDKSHKKSVSEIRFSGEQSGSDYLNKSALIVTLPPLDCHWRVIW